MKSLFPEGHDVFGGDLQFAETSREFEDRQRMVALVGDQYGIVSGFDVTDNSDVSDNKLVISAGLAFDALGYRLNMASGTTVSGILPSDIGNYVAIYVENSQTNPTAHPVTGASAYTKEVDGVVATIVSSVVSGSGHIMVACITNVVTGAVPSVDFSTSVRSCREELTIDPDRLGTGLDVAEHRRSAHSDGISGGTTSLVPSIFDAATDHITFTQMDSTHWVSINGVLLGSEEINPVGNVTFNTVVDAAGSWNIYMDSSGATGKTQSALTADRFLIATVIFDASGDLSSLVDLRVFYEMTQDLVRVDLVEAETNDSLSADSTIRNNLNRVRHRLNVLETVGRFGTVIANSGGDFNGTTDAVFTQAIASLPASGGTLFVADGIWNFAAPVSVTKPITFRAGESTVINVNAAVSPNTTFSITADSCIFDGFTFNLNVASGNSVQHVLSFNGIDHALVENNILDAEAPGGNLYGEMVLINDCAAINVKGNHLHSDTGQMEVVRVDSPTICTGIIINRNLMKGNGCSNLLHVENGGVDLLNVVSNQAHIGTTGARRIWILTDAGTNIHGMTVVSNQYYNLNNSSSTNPKFVELSHTGDTVISSNSIRFTNPGTTTPIGMSVNEFGVYVVSNNLIKDANIGIGVACNESVFNGNNIIGVTSQGMVVLGDDNTIQGNIIRGSGSDGIWLNGASKTIIDGCNIDGFTNDITESAPAGNYFNENPASDNAVTNITTI